MRRGDIRTPAFMPVGTAATVKAMKPGDVRAAVPTGMKAGVRMSPRRMEIVPVRARPFVADMEKENRITPGDCKAVAAKARSVRGDSLDEPGKKGQGNR
jgi:hypothetical protein